MNQAIKDQNSLYKENFNSRTGELQQQSNAANKDTVKNIKIYIPAENFDSKLSFEQNLEEGKVKLFTEMPVENFGEITDPILKTQGTAINENPQAISSKNASDFQKSITETQNFSSTSFYMTKQHNCDVCYQSFSQRRDLALHYLLHSEKEKRRAAKGRKKCDICNKIIFMCNCKRIFEESYPEYSNLPSFFSISQLPNCSTFFIKRECSSGNSSVIKRELFNCPECEQTFGLEMQLKQHLLVHKRKRKSNTEKQDGVFSAESNSRNTDETQKLFPCPDCDQSFGLVKQLKQHALVHKKHPYTVFRCKLCRETFEDNSSLMFHAATVHPSNT